MLKPYNTIIRENKVFKPLKNKKVKMVTSGPSCASKL